MNTSKQINIMVLLVFVAVFVTGGYVLWDPIRAEDAEDTQLGETIERAAFLFSANCRTCHGDSGEGGTSSGRLRQAPALNRPDFQGRAAEGEPVDELLKLDRFKHIYFTIQCGRVGKFMPAWSQVQGGPLNDEQIKLLTVLITEGGEGWDEAKHFAVRGNHLGHDPGDDKLGLSLADAIDETATTIRLNGDAKLVAPASRLSIDRETQVVVEEPEDAAAEGEAAESEQAEGEAAPEEQKTHSEFELIELMLVLDDTELPLQTAIDASATQIALDTVEGMRVGDTLTIGPEEVKVTAIDAATNVVQIDRPLVAEFKKNPPKVEEGKPDPREQLIHAAGDPVVNVHLVNVERGLNRTDPTAHEAGTEVLTPPVPSADPEVTEQSCGQLAQASGGAPVATTNTPTIIAKGLAWNTAILSVPVGQPITLTVDNQDTDAHNFHISEGIDPGGAEVALSDLEPGPIVQTLNFGPLAAGDYFYVCDVHPSMEGVLTAVDPAAATPAADSAATP